MQKSLTLFTVRQPLRKAFKGRVRLRITDLIDDDRRIAGYFEPGVIEIALGSPVCAAATIDHEAVHALREMGLFTDAEWAALERAARADTAMMASVARRYPDLSEVDLIEEAIADRYAVWSARQRKLGALRRMLHRMNEELGQNEDAAVMRLIWRGAVGAR